MERFAKNSFSSHLIFHVPDTISAAITATIVAKTTLFHRALTLYFTRSSLLFLFQIYRKKELTKQINKIYCQYHFWSTTTLHNPGNHKPCLFLTPQSHDALKLY